MKSKKILLRVLSVLIVFSVLTTACGAPATEAPAAAPLTVTTVAGPPLETVAVATAVSTSWRPYGSAKFTGEFTANPYRLIPPHYPIGSRFSHRCRLGS